MHRRHALRRPLTSPTPPLPPHSQPPGRGGALKKQSKQSPSSPRVGGREVGEEGRGGEGSGGAFTVRFKRTSGSGLARIGSTSVNPTHRRIVPMSKKLLALLLLLALPALAQEPAA